MYRILLVEDDADIASLERDYLEAAGMKVEMAEQAEEVLKADCGGFDLILLDVMLPGVNGYEACRKIREESDVPIILVTAKSEPTDIIKGLGLGSDDYITKPFDPAVLVARVKAGIEGYRRHKQLGEEIRAKGLRIMPGSRQVFDEEGEEIRLTNKEFELLLFLAQHPGKVFSKEDIFEEVWGLESLAEEAMVTVHINRLREKLGAGRIETAWGRGYRF